MCKLCPFFVKRLEQNLKIFWNCHEKKFQHALENTKTCGRNPFGNMVVETCSGNTCGNTCSGITCGNTCSGNTCGDALDLNMLCQKNWKIELHWKIE